jgi:virulence factor Mce-like protein
MKGPPRFFRELVAPSRTARAIPLGRLAIGAVFVFVALFIAFTLSSMGVQLPFVSNPYEIRAEFVDGAGLDPSNGPQVSVAGVPEGQVTGVRYERGRALVTIDLGSGARGKVFRDARAEVRPFNGANFLQVDILPGHPAAGPLAGGGLIESSRTSIPVATDQVLGVLDADTRSYLQLLTEQAAGALHGAGGELGHALQRLAPLSSEARQIGAMLAQRRSLISQLVGEANVIFRTLGRRHAELADTLRAATRILAVTGSRSREIELATRELPSVLAQGQATSTAIGSVAPELEQALTRFAPAATAFASGLRATRHAVPALESFRAALDSLARATLVPSRELVRFATHLDQGVGSAISSYTDLIQIMRTIVSHKEPISHFSDAISGALSTQDAYGVLGRVKIIGIQTPRPEDLGLTPAAASRAAGNGHSTLEDMLGVALGQLCRRSQPLACVVALATPGLPGSLVPRSQGRVPMLASTRPGGRP